ncbi:MAG: glycoside hydrolase family 3 N-terminal domain-containing protein [Elusimicrobiaceae bacterium]|nr:glycoside hydrolase family 3 N-terminal domain-containing protein [Elusimicrobiaceae bacterium]
MGYSVAELVFPAFRFWENDTAYALELAELGAGGFCLYGGTPAKIRELVAAVRRVSPEVMFCADYEDGAGRWVSSCAELPSNMAIAASGDAELAYRKGWHTALAARALGVDCVLAPVADLAVRADNPIVNTRAFSAEPGKTALFCAEFLRGLNAGGVPGCVKHFPGHGDTGTDSHLGLPVIEKELAAFMASDAAPFAALARTADAVMPGHLLVRALDADNPASFSAAAIDGLLRGEMGFSGCVITDALSMKAVSDETQAALKALAAGADILLVPQEPVRLIKALNKALKEGGIPLGVMARAMRSLAGLRRRKKELQAAAPGLSGAQVSAAREFNAETARRCCAFAGPAEFEPLKSGDTLRVFETSPRKPPFFAGSQDPLADERGDSVFVKTLKWFGVNAVAHDAPCRERSPFCAVSFSRPRAYAGSINLSGRDIVIINNAAAGAERFFMVSFGSPFVFGSATRTPDCGICAFCAIDEYQAFCARVLLGMEKPAGSFEYTKKP